MSDKILELSGLSKYYTSAQSVVMGLNNVSLSFSTGEFVAITGESGSGKSTLAKVAAGILPYESGELLIGGRPTSHYDGTDWENYRRNNISYISQDYDILPGCTVMSNVVSALRLSGVSKAAAHEKAEKILAQVELCEYKGRRAAKLSSGQKQRLSIARALAKPAPILIADEPTGNLDAENSAKVIKLLAQAAKERLVLLITHEFSEAEDCATRRIVIHDGTVSADVTLRDAALPKNEGGTAPSKNTARGLGLYTAALQLSARPVWTAAMLLLFAVTAFAVFAFLGTFIVHLDDTYTRVYDDSAFMNGDMCRIVAARYDGGEITQEDIRTLLTLDYIVSIERYGYLADVSYAYREGVDYEYVYKLASAGLGTYSPTSALSIKNTGLYVRTVPVYADGRQFITAGRLPETVCEVVAAGDASVLGETLTVYIRDSQNWNVDAYVKLDVQIVGVTDEGSGLYFADDVGRMFTSRFMGSEYLVGPNYTDELENGFLVAESMYQTMKNMIAPADGPMHRPGGGPVREYTGPELLGCHDSSYKYYIEVSPQMFAEVVSDSMGNQVSITIEDYAYAERVIESAGTLGYVSISPYREGSTAQNPSLAAERLQTLKVCCLALAAVLILQVVVLRAMFNIQMDGYRILSNIGLSCRDAKRSVLWQMLLFALGGQLLGYAAVRLCAAAGVERIIHVLRYLPAPYIALLSGVHLAAGAIATLWMMHILRRRTYPFSGRRADLDMSMMEEGVGL